MAQKVILLGQPGIGKTEYAMFALKEKFGEDIIIYTPKQAREEGLKMEDFCNVPTFTINAPLIEENKNVIFPVPDGKANRRNRRKNERKSHKKKW